MKRYDPEVPPDPAEWLRLDEQERIRLIEEHHREQRIELPNLKLHAVFHAIVENQIAEQLESSLRGLTRLTAEGLSRHDALHAMGSVVAEHLYETMRSKDEDSAASAQARYNAAVERLTAKEWLRSYRQVGPRRQPAPRTYVAQPLSRTE